MSSIPGKLTSGNLGEPQLYMHGERICSEADFLLVKDRIATLEADLAVERERSAALAATVSAVYGVLENIQELNPSNYDHDQVCDLNSKMVEAWLCVEGGEHEVILAAHDAEVARKAKVEALEAYRSWMWESGYPDETEFMREALRRIAALNAEGGKG